jgi:hypothetical protein
MRSAEQPTNAQRNQCGRKGLFFNELSCHIADGTDQFRGVLLNLRQIVCRRTFHAIFVHSLVSYYLDDVRTAIPMRIPTLKATATATSGRCRLSSPIRSMAIVPSLAASLLNAAD